MARVGDFLLVLFQATQEAAKFGADGIRIMLPSGEAYNCIGIEEGRIHRLKTTAANTNGDK
ncbi:MAG: hypothetical protein OEL20_04815 [Sulfuritalea sp.]|nr:hypothetical protein [Sulfuritalea sp.]